MVFLTYPTEELGVCTSGSMVTCEEWGGHGMDFGVSEEQGDVMVS